MQFKSIEAGNTANVEQLFPTLDPGKLQSAISYTPNALNRPNPKLVKSASEVPSPFTSHGPTHHPFG